MEWTTELALPLQVWKVEQNERLRNTLFPDQFNRLFTGIMEDTNNILWMFLGTVGSLVVGFVSFVVKQAITKNATKENISAKTDLLEKDIVHLNKEMEGCRENNRLLHKRISDLRESSKEVFVSKELFHQTITQLNEKLDTILRFVESK